jgi:hypothetical protein
MAQGRSRSSGAVPPPAASAALAAATPVVAGPARAAAAGLAASALAPPPSADADVLRQRQWEDVLGRRGHYQHKGRWSWFLMAMMAGMLAFQSLLLGLVGADIWDFEGYEWLLPALLVQNLAQIAGLCVIVVKALFRDLD